jgi:hypothetical protein
MILRRQSRTDRLVREARGVSPLARGVLSAFAVAVLLGLTYMARRRLWQAIAIFADAVEEVADTVEDTAEDVRDAARERAEAG